MNITSSEYEASTGYTCLKINDIVQAVSESQVLPQSDRGVVTRILCFKVSIGGLVDGAGGVPSGDTLTLTDNVIVLADVDVNVDAGLWSGQHDQE